MLNFYFHHSLPHFLGKKSLNKLFYICLLTPNLLLNFHLKAHGYLQDQMQCHMINLTYSFCFTDHVVLIGTQSRIGHVIDLCTGVCITSPPEEWTRSFLTIDQLPWLEIVGPNKSNEQSIITSVQVKIQEWYTWSLVLKWSVQLGTFKSVIVKKGFKIDQLFIQWIDATKASQGHNAM